MLCSACYVQVTEHRECDHRLWSQSVRLSLPFCLQSTPLKSLSAPYIMEAHLWEPFLTSSAPVSALGSLSHAFLRTEPRAYYFALPQHLLGECGFWGGPE